MSVALGIPWLLLLLMFGLAAFSGLRLNRAAGTRRGRRALIHGIAILAVLCLLVVLVLLLMALLRSAGNHPTVWTPVPHVVEAPRAPQPATIPLDSPPVAASRHSRPLVERETPVAADSRTASAKQAQMAGVLRALGNALVKVAAESPQAEAAADWGRRSGSRHGVGAGPAGVGRCAAEDHERRLSSGRRRGALRVAAGVRA